LSAPRRCASSACASATSDGDMDATRAAASAAREEASPPPEAAAPSACASAAAAGAYAQGTHTQTRQRAGCADAQACHACVRRGNAPAWAAGAAARSVRAGRRGFLRAASPAGRRASWAHPWHAPEPRPTRCPPRRPRRRAPAAAAGRQARRAAQLLTQPPGALARMRMPQQRLRRRGAACAPPWRLAPRAARPGRRGQRRRRRRRCRAAARRRAAGTTQAPLAPPPPSRRAPLPLPAAEAPPRTRSAPARRAAPRRSTAAARQQRTRLPQPQRAAERAGAPSLPAPRCPPGSAPGAPAALPAPRPPRPAAADAPWSRGAVCLFVRSCVRSLLLASALGAARCRRRSARAAHTTRGCSGARGRCWPAARCDGHTGTRARGEPRLRGRASWTAQHAAPACSAAIMRGLTKGEKLAALAAGGALIAGGAYLYRRRKSAQVRTGARARTCVWQRCPLRALLRTWRITRVETHGAARALAARRRHARAMLRRGARATTDARSQPFWAGAHHRAALQRPPAAARQREAAPL
jgi:hypothetical protein